MHVHVPAPGGEELDPELRETRDRVAPLCERFAVVEPLAALLCERFGVVEPLAAPPCVRFGVVEPLAAPPCVRFGVVEPLAAPPCVRFGVVEPLAAPPCVRFGVVEPLAAPPCVRFGVVEPLAAPPCVRFAVVEPLAAPPCVRFGVVEPLAAPPCVRFGVVEPLAAPLCERFGVVEPLAAPLCERFGVVEPLAALLEPLAADGGGCRGSIQPERDDLAKGIRAGPGQRPVPEEVDLPRDEPRHVLAGLHGRLQGKPRLAVQRALPFVRPRGPPSARAIMRAVPETFPCFTMKPLFTPIPREALRRESSQEGRKGGRG